MVIIPTGSGESLNIDEEFKSNGKSGEKSSGGGFDFSLTNQGTHQFLSEDASKNSLTVDINLRSALTSDNLPEHRNCRTHTAN